MFTKFISPYSEKQGEGNGDGELNKNTVSEKTTDLIRSLEPNLVIFYILIYLLSIKSVLNRHKALQYITVLQFIYIYKFVT
jgi:hypothetical protein